MPSQSNVKSIGACIEVGESRIFKTTLVSQWNGNPNLKINTLRLGMVYHIQSLNYSLLQRMILC